MVVPKWLGWNEEHQEQQKIEDEPPSGRGSKEPELDGAEPTEPEPSGRDAGRRSLVINDSAISGHGAGCRCECSNGDGRR